MSVDSLLRIGRFNGTYNGIIYRYSKDGQLAYPYYNPNLPPFTVAQENVRKILNHQAFIWSALKAYIYSSYILESGHISIYNTYCSLTFENYDRLFPAGILKDNTISNSYEHITSVASVTITSFGLLSMVFFNYSTYQFKSEDNSLDTLTIAIVNEDGAIVEFRSNAITRGARNQQVVLSVSNLTLGASYYLFCWFNSVSSYNISRVWQSTFTYSLL